MQGAIKPLSIAAPASQSPHMQPLRRTILKLFKMVGNAGYAKETPNECNHGRPALEHQGAQHQRLFFFSSRFGISGAGVAVESSPAPLNAR
jgi:hypothetical protein